MTTGIRLKAPWWARFTGFEATRVSSNSKAKTAPPATGGDELLKLDARTLRDIGAPDSMLARAHARRAAELQELDNLRFGIEAGAGAWWRRW